MAMTVRGHALAHFSEECSSMSGGPKLVFSKLEAYFVKSLLCALIISEEVDAPFEGLTTGGYSQRFDLYHSYF